MTDQRLSYVGHHVYVGIDVHKDTSSVTCILFERIAATRGKQRAIVAIARRLVGRIRACFRHGTTYAVGTAA